MEHGPKTLGRIFERAEARYRHNLDSLDYVQLIWLYEFTATRAGGSGSIRHRGGRVIGTTDDQPTDGYVSAA